MSVQEKEINVQTKSYCCAKVVITEKSKKFICKLLNDVAQLKEHNTHKIFAISCIKEVRRIVDNPLNKVAAIQMDWAENTKFFQCRQENSAYYYDIQVSVNMAVVYQANKSTTWLDLCRTTLAIKRLLCGHL